MLPPTATMSSYDSKSTSTHYPNHPPTHSTPPVEHSVPPSNSNTVPSSTSHPRSRRPDFSTFYSHLAAHTDTSATENRNATPMPSDISASYGLLAEGFERMRQDQGGEEDTSSVLIHMITLLTQESERPPSAVEGVGQDFLDRG